MKSDLLTYHFLKYDKDIPFDYYIKSYAHHSWLCFDLEDSIQDIRNPANTSILKQKSRESLCFIFQTYCDKLSNLNIAIRINPIHSVEFIYDIDALAKSHAFLNKLSLFLPKTESADDVLAFQDVLNSNNIQYNEVIALIESKTGMANLPSLLNYKSDKFNKIAYGHCDYNFSLGNFPFYHQDSDEYWNVVVPMMKLVESKGFLFINSPVLSLDNQCLLDSTLEQLESHSTSESFGQIILTHKQARCCCNHKRLSLLSPFKAFDNDNNQINDKRKYALKLITDYEYYLNGKAFSINGSNINLISPNEYLAAKHYLLHG